MRLRLAACRTGASGPSSPLWPIRAQDVYRQRRKSAHQRVRIELARGQPREVQVGLELGVELLVRAVVCVQGDDLPGIESARQRGRPAVEFVLGQYQVLAARADRALDEPQHPAHRTLYIGKLNSLLPDDHPLALARVLPVGTVGVEFSSHQLSRIEA